MITDEFGKILYINPAWERLYGFNQSEVLGQTPKFLHSGKHDSTFYKNMWKAITDPKLGHWKGEIINRTKSDTLLPVYLMITTIRRPDQSIYGYVGIATDFRVHKEGEKKNRQQENLAALRTFSEGLAHQIGTTLGVIRGRAEFLEAQPSSKRTVQSSAKTIIEQADRIQQCVEYLLQFCRTTRGLDLQEVEIAPLLREIHKHYEKRAQDLMISFRFKHSDHPPIKGDSQRIKNILIHLLDNAIDAIENERANPKKAGTNHEIHVYTEEHESEIKITIRDTGCGIEEKDLDKIFQPFFTKKDIGQGIGLGLSLALTLTQDFGGRISVTSQPGAGSAFTLHIPKA